MQQPGVTRRGFFGTAGNAGLAVSGAAMAGLAGSVLAGAAPAQASTADPGQGAAEFADGAGPAPDGRRPGPQEALRILLAGNRRWVLGQARHPRQSRWWRHHLATGQNPFATVVSCIDSRVPPELVFDCGLGEILTLRTGAQTIDDRVVLGSIEYGPATWASTRLILVLGHSGCGAVNDAIKVISSGGRAPGHIQAVVDALRPAYHAALGLPGNQLNNTIRAQIRLTVRRLERQPLLSDLIRRDGLMIVGGHYDLHSGLVTITT
ncbi:MAG TPA: carbonic anhydrase [Streptosporangiaceae bacterium]|jgi:carbonic anhydrase